jgi:hypothetical protein
LPQIVKQIIKMALRVLVIAALAVFASAQNSTQSAPGRFICNCPGIEGKDYVCGVDGQVTLICNTLSEAQSRQVAQAGPIAYLDYLNLSDSVPQRILIQSSYFAHMGPTGYVYRAA